MASPWYLGSWRWTWGHKFCDSTDQTVGWTDAIDVHAALGEDGNNDPAHMKEHANVDFSGKYCTDQTRQPFWCGMRFCHQDDATGNFLFCDGHVESRTLGEVLWKDICVNFQ